MEDFFEYMNEIYSDRDNYSRGKIIDMAKEKYKELHEIPKLEKETDGLSLIPDAIRFGKDMLRDWDEMSDDWKKSIINAIVKTMESEYDIKAPQTCGICGEGTVKFQYLLAHYKCDKCGENFTD